MRFEESYGAKTHLFALATGEFPRKGNILRFDQPLRLAALCPANRCRWRRFVGVGLKGFGDSEQEDANRCDTRSVDFSAHEPPE